MKSDRLTIVALVGRPNVGKSSLFNRLARKKEAIVDSTPGVTRDRHYGKIEWQGQKFILVDTGGIEPTPTKDGETGMAFPREIGVEAQARVVDGMRQQTWLAVEEADVVFCLLDGREGLANEDFLVAQSLRKSGKPVFFLVNKVDGPEAEDLLVPQFYELGIDTLWPVSAAHGYGISTLMDALLEILVTPSAEQNDPAEGAISVACIGRPNVGKSSLINRLLGEARMLVSEVPGTTRDSVDTLFEKDGEKYLLIDTAGIRRRGKVSEKLEKFSVMQALSALERCDLALLLIDAGEGITEQDTKVIGYAFDRGRACIVVINKWDLVKGDKKRQDWIKDDVDKATRFIGYAPSLTLSALSGKGVGSIFPAIRGVFEQFSLEFTTNRLNKVLQQAVEEHNPPMHKGRRLKFYYVTQVATRPPTFVLFVNYPKGVHFSYYRFLANRFRDGLGLDKSPLRLIMRERERKKYG
ncbi:MAG: ribosome biogenesis GTPase Der [Proteobacteria bacterium]|nr:ribosome biogenesis GTPase Der [Pseudomonadota bacterium]MBU1738612.1 ribosome biogenesis GTPase Der [Pseudomonadota bacterium]